MRSTFATLLRSCAQLTSTCERTPAPTGLGGVGPFVLGPLVGGALLGGCNGALWGNVVVLGVTVGIFLGTLTLGRSTDGRGGSASRSTPSDKVR